GRCWLHVPALHHQFGCGTMELVGIESHRDGLFLARQQREIVIAPENWRDILPALAAREPRMHHERNAVALILSDNGKQGDLSSKVYPLRDSHFYGGKGVQSRK